MRRFELRDGDKHVYWTIKSLSPGRCEIKFGNVGGPQRAITRTYDGPAAFDAMIAKQLALGYAEVTEPAKVIATISNERWSRRFEHGDRFVEITFDGHAVTQRTGVIGSDDPGTFSTARHPTAAEARDIVERVIAVLVSDGFVVTTERELAAGESIAAGTQRSATNPELEAQCRAQPDDPAPWAVYADWLMTQGDPRGELAALRAGGRESEATRLFAANAVALFGDDDVVATVVRLSSWRHGFAVAARIRNQDPDDGANLADVTARFLALPIATFVESLQFGLAGFSNRNNWAPTLAAVTSSPIAGRVRELRFDDFTYQDCELSWAPFGDFSDAWPKLPALETLAIKSGAGGTLGTLDLPELRRFERISGGLSRTELEAIVNARWPKLEHLEIWTGSANYGAQSNVFDLLPLVDGDALPALRHLGIVDSELLDDVVEYLAKGKLLPRLRTLDLSKGSMAEVGARLLVEFAAAYRHLAWIDLGENQLLPDEIARIRAVLPQVRAGEQRERNVDYVEGDDDDDDGRYVAIGE